MTARDVAIVILFAVVALATVPLAVALDSAVPLFFAWLPQAGLLAYLSMRDRAQGHAASPRNAADPTRPVSRGEPVDAR